MSQDTATPVTLDTYAATIAANLSDPSAIRRTAVAVGKALTLPGATLDGLAYASSLAAARAAHPNADPEALTLLAGGKTFGISTSTLGRYSLTYRIIIAAGIRTTDTDAFRHAWNLAKAGRGKAALKAAEGWRATPDTERAEALAAYALTGVTAEATSAAKAAAKREAAAAAKTEQENTEAIAEGVTVSPAMVTPDTLFHGTDWTAIVGALVARATALGTDQADALYAALTDGQDAIIGAATAAPVAVAA